MNNRQEEILKFIGENDHSSVGLIFSHLQKQGNTIAQITVSRDIEKLLQKKFIERKGAGRSTYYVLSHYYTTHRDIDVDAYFLVDVDERAVKEKFNFDIFSLLKDIFTDEEKKKLHTINNVYQEKLKKLSDDVFKKERERLTIDFSWKSSKIEGNTYSLLETEQLLREAKKAEGHNEEEALMILNHKKALEYIHASKSDFQQMSIQKIEDIHSLLVEDLHITKGIRKNLVRITGTKYVPLDKAFQIQEALDKTCQAVNDIESPFEKAVILMLLIAYIQPFTDGNKRTSRLCGNAILEAFDVCPLSYRSIDDLEYKKAVLLFYEQNNATYFKKLFLQQFSFVVDNYFG